MDNHLFKSRPTKAIVNLKNLENNLKVVKSIVKKKKIMAVVKADAYGHGLIEIAKKFQQLKVDYFGVAYLEEAIILRNNGIRTPILVLGAVNKYQIKNYLKNDIHFTGSSLEKLREISNTAKRLKTKAKVHIKIDTGMARIGVQWDRVEKFFSELFLLDGLEIVGIYTHFSSSDVDRKYTMLQRKRFENVLNLFSKYINLKKVIVHMANSTTVTNYPISFHKDMVRTGLLLYGYSGNPKIQKKLKPVMSFKTVVSYFKVLEKGCPVGYKKMFTTTKQTRIVTLPMGYADGYPIEFSNNSIVWINSKIYPIVGRLCMDQCMVDIGNGEAYVGDEVEIFGENISLWDLCKNSLKSPYTILTGISQRVPRVYI
jgi:alanine racemase